MCIATKPQNATNWTYVQFSWPLKMFMWFLYPDSMWRYFIKPSNQYAFWDALSCDREIERGRERVCVVCRFLVEYRNYLYFEFLCFGFFFFMMMGECVLNFNVAERGRISKYFSVHSIYIYIYMNISSFDYSVFMSHERLKVCA